MCQLHSNTGPCDVLLFSLCCTLNNNLAQPLIKETKTEASRRVIDLVPQIVCYLEVGRPEDFVLGGEEPLSYTQVRRMCERIRRDTGFEESIAPIRFRTTVLTDLYDATKDIKQAQTGQDIPRRQ